MQIYVLRCSRKWQREHKNAIGSPVFGYLGNGQVKTPVMGQAPYQVTLEDRMRWAQIADVMAQANHYAVSYEVWMIKGMLKVNLILTRSLSSHTPPVAQTRLNPFLAEDRRRPCMDIRIYKPLAA